MKNKVEIECPSCRQKIKLQLIFKESNPYPPYRFQCPHCKDYFAIVKWEY